MTHSGPPSGAGDYAVWRSTRLGSAVETVEAALVFRLAGPLAGRRVLDVGCGDGTYAIGAARRGAHVTAVDSDADVLRRAAGRARAASVGVDWRTEDAHRLPFSDATFDVVTAVTVLCVVRDPEDIVREMARVLAPGGRLVVGEINRWSPWAAWRRTRTWLGRADWSRVRFWSAEELRRLVRAAGLHVERVGGAVWFPPVEAWASPLSRFDSRVGALTRCGAAFLAISARRPSRAIWTAAPPRRGRQ